MSIARRTGWYALSSILVPLFGLLALPLYTLRLYPEHFGVLALSSSLVTFISAVASSVSSLSLPAELNRHVGENRRRYVGSVLLLGITAALIVCGFIFVAYSIAASKFRFDLFDDTALGLTMAAALLTSFWAISIEIITIEGYAKHYAVVTILQTLISVAGVCAAIFVFDDVDNALLWGMFFSGIVGALGAVTFFYGRASFKEIKSWLAVAVRGGFASTLTSATENGKVTVERLYVGLSLGASELGLMAHGQYYKNAAMVLINAVSRALQPTSLSEARNSPPIFRTTLQLWIPVQATVVGISVGLALVGHEVIGGLTHGKFVGATHYAVAFMQLLLLQTLAKPHANLLLVRGHGYLHAHLHTAAIVFGLVCMFIAVPFLGIWGVIMAFAIQTLTHRIALYRLARRIYPLPFTDYWVIFGGLFTGVCMVFVITLDPEFEVRSGLLFCLYSIFLWRFREKILFLFAKKNILSSSRSQK